MNTYERRCAKWLSVGNLTKIPSNDFLDTARKPAVVDTVITGRRQMNYWKSTLASFEARFGFGSMTYNASCRNRTSSARVAASITITLLLSPDTSGC
jgi:hypothetical protein